MKNIQAQVSSLTNHYVVITLYNYEVFCQSSKQIKTFWMPFHDLYSASWTLPSISWYDYQRCNFVDL
jgi:hypothetical protein